MFDELELGIVKPGRLEQFNSVIQQMHDESGIEAIILGCTELPLLFNGHYTPVPKLDTMKIHISEIVDMITE